LDLDQKLVELRNGGIDNANPIIEARRNN